MKKERINSLVVIIVIISIVKIVLMGLFSSDYQNKMFMPFVDCFLDGRNPYEYYHNNNLISSFPYFPLMLIIESVGGVLNRFLCFENVFLQNIMFKIPLLAFDVIGLVFLLKMEGIRPKYVVCFYYASPIIIYGSYMHGQLDIIPTVLLLIAVYYLINTKIKHNYWLFSIALGLALSTKMHVLATVPLLFIYVYKKKGLIKAFLHHILSFATVIIITTPFWCKGFVETVIFNKDQTVIFGSYLNYNTSKLIIPVFLMILVYYNAFKMVYINKFLLISFLNLSFGVFLTCVHSMPAWYIWVIPFLTVFIGYSAKNNHNIMILSSVFGIFYLVFYVFFHHTDMVDLYIFKKNLSLLKIDVSKANDLAFTLMIVCLVVLTYEIYRLGVSQNNYYKRRGEAFAIGVAGDSGAGKSSMLHLIEKMINSPQDIQLVEGDGDHKWERNDKKWEEFTALDPQANYLYKQAEDIYKLKKGYYIERHDYDHNKGVFTDIKRVKSKKFILFGGLHAFYLPRLRDVFDLKVFIRTDENLRCLWKIKRDSKDRGHSINEIVEQIKKRRIDAERYIYPQEKSSDICIEYFDSNLIGDIVKGDFDVEYDPKLSVKIRIGIDYDIESIMNELTANNISIDMKLSGDYSFKEYTIHGESVSINTIDYSDIADRFIPQYEDFLNNKPVWEEGINGLIQLVLLYMISVKMRG